MGEGRQSMHFEHHARACTHTHVHVHALVRTLDPAPPAPPALLLLLLLLLPPPPAPASPPPGYQCAGEQLRYCS
ncbi:hypothetical protein CPB84DRAFT_1857182 [Gymnopilus junonius]|uniref:Uncharacterized protein n=1 Tax=Gymnopilus junonius TaxID=109634 RepID=A0A9P5N7R6_GYMJU|nr:hypothetical protein CPB84DRAFT_1857182 [Gymnopilus junonius]